MVLWVSLHGGGWPVMAKQEYKISKLLLTSLLVMVLIALSYPIVANGKVPLEVERTTGQAVAETPYPTYMPEGLKDLQAEYSKAKPAISESSNEEEQNSNEVTVFSTVDYDPGPSERTIWYQVAAPEDKSIFEGRGWWLPEPVQQQTTINGLSVNYGVQNEQFEFEGKQYNRPWTWIEWEKDGVVIRVLGINVEHNEVIKLAQSVR